jgi:hypothetical protein
MSMIAVLSIWQMQPGLYEYRVMNGDQELFADAGFESIKDAIADASSGEGPLTAMEVSYSGIVGGTFPMFRLRTDAAGVAKHLVETMASVLE